MSDLAIALRARRSTTLAFRSSSLWLTLLVFVATAPIAAADSTITLRDGSSIHGEVVSLVDGVYTIRSSSSGTLKIPQSEVRGVTNDAPPENSQQLEQIQQRISSDPQTLSAITSLQDSPELKAILDDPELMKALQAGDLQSLLSNPKVEHFAADPRVQEITRKLGQ